MFRASSALEALAPPSEPIAVDSPAGARDAIRLDPVDLAGWFGPGPEGRAESRLRGDLAGMSLAAEVPRAAFRGDQCRWM